MRPRTWPTPSKNEMFRSSKEKNVIVTTYSEVDTSLCNVDAPLLDSPLTCTVDPGVGEQDKEWDPSLCVMDSARYLSAVETSDSLYSYLIASREKMNVAYEKEFTSVEDCLELNGRFNM